MKNIRFPGITALVGLLLVTASTLAQAEVIEKSFAVKPGGTLYVDSDSGAIEVKSHRSNSVEIEVEKKGKNAKNFVVTFSQDGDNVTVKGDHEGISGWGWSSARVYYTIKVPENYNVSLETGGGSIDVSDLIGEVEADTSGGSISLGQIKGDVAIKTSGGSIRVEEVSGNIDAHTSGGSITAKISQQPTDDCRLSTSGGSVTAYLAKEIAVDLDASTSGGRVKSDFMVEGRVKKTSIRGKINGGGPELKLKTSGGSVRIKAL